MMHCRQNNSKWLPKNGFTHEWGTYNQIVKTFAAYHVQVVTVGNSNKKIST